MSLVILRVLRSFEKNILKNPKGVLCFMKKFFALFTIVALLAVAGSAFAATPTVSFSPSPLSVTRGGSNSAVVTAAPGNTGGTIESVTLGSDAPSWVDLSGSVSLGYILTETVPSDINLAAGDYTVTLTATESYSAGHASQTATGTGTITITVREASSAEDENDDGTSYSANVADTTVAAISSALGETVQKLPSTVTLTKNSTDPTELVFSDSNTRGVVALPIMTDIPAGTYVLELTLPANMSRVTAVPVLYPNGASSTPVAVKFFGGTNGTTEITDSNVSTLFAPGETVNMVFSVGSDGSFVATSVEAAAAMSNPVLAVTSTQVNPSGPGKSSGGCDAGFTALALAVLGGFIATRRK